MSPEAESRDLLCTSIIEPRVPSSRTLGSWNFSCDRAAFVIDTADVWPLVKVKDLPAVLLPSMTDYS